MNVQDVQRAEGRGRLFQQLPRWDECVPDVLKPPPTQVFVGQKTWLALPSSADQELDVTCHGVPEIAQIELGTVSVIEHALPGLVLVEGRTDGLLPVMLQGRGRGRNAVERRNPAAGPAGEF